MSTQSFARLALFAGLATLGFFVAFNLLPEVGAAYSPGALGDAISVFQRAETLEALAPVFGEPVNAGIVAAMNAVNTLDLFGFIPAYTIFLVASAATLAGGFKGLLVWLPIVAALIGAAGDVIETMRQLDLTAMWAAAGNPAEWPSDAAGVMPIATWHYVKYFGLAANALGAALLCLAHAPKRLILGVLGVAPILGTAAVFAGVTESGRAIALPFAAFWVALLVVCGIEALRKRA